MFVSVSISIELPSHHGVTSVEAGANLQGGFNVLCNKPRHSQILKYYRQRWCCCAAASYLQKEVTAICVRTTPGPGYPAPFFHITVVC